MALLYFVAIIIHHNSYKSNILNRNSVILRKCTDYLNLHLQIITRVKTSSFGGAISVYAYNAPDI